MTNIHVILHLLCRKPDFSFTYMGKPSPFSGPYICISTSKSMFSSDQSYEMGDIISFRYKYMKACIYLYFLLREISGSFVHLLSCKFLMMRLMDVSAVETRELSGIPSNVA